MDASNYISPIYCNNAKAIEINLLALAEKKYFIETLVVNKKNTIVDILLIALLYIWNVKYCFYEVELSAVHKASPSY